MMQEFFRLGLWRKICIWLLFVLPIIVFIFIFDKYALNIPHWDDFAIRNSIQQFIKSNDIFEKIRILFAQHNEHRIFLTRIVALLIFQLTNSLNWKYLMVVGNALLLLILLIYYKVFQKKSLNFYYFVPTSWLLLTSALYENVYWGMASVQNFGVIALALLSFYWIIFYPHRYFLFLGVVVASMAVFTSSNGLLVPILLLAVLLFQRRKEHFWIALVVFLLIYVLFFLGFQQIPDKSLHTHFNVSSFSRGLLATLGAMFDFTFLDAFLRIDLAMAFGLLILILVGLFAGKVLFYSYDIQQKNIDLFLLISLLFFGLTAAGISVGRMAYGIETLMSSKYKIYSVLIVISIYFVLMGDLSERGLKRWGNGALFVAMMAWVLVYFQNFAAIRLLHQERLTDDFSIFQASGVQKSGLMINFLRNISNEAMLVSDSANVMKVSELADKYVFEMAAEGKVFDFRKPEDGLYLLLKNHEKMFVLPTRLFPWGRKAYFSVDFLLNKQLKVNIFVAEVPKYQVPKGVYRIGKLIRQKGKSSVIWSKQSMNFQGQTLKEVQKNW